MSRECKYGIAGPSVSRWPKGLHLSVSRVLPSASGLTGGGPSSSSFVWLSAEFSCLPVAIHWPPSVPYQTGCSVDQLATSGGKRRSCNKMKVLVIFIFIICKAFLVEYHFISKGEKNDQTSLIKKCGSCDMSTKRWFLSGTPFLYNWVFFNSFF